MLFKTRYILLLFFKKKNIVGNVLILRLIQCIIRINYLVCSVGKNDLHLYNTLPPHKQEEVEKLLTSSLEQTWKNLAGELGYQDELIDTFTQDEFPVRALLSDWSSKDSATTDALYSALRKIQREDIAQSLYSDSTATSPV